MFEVTGAMPSQKYIVTDKKTNRGGMSVVVPSSGDQVQVWHHPATHSLSDPSSNRTMPSNPPEIYNKLKSLSTLVTSLTICLTAESLSPHCIIFPGDVYTETLRPHGHGLRSSSLGPDWLRDKFRVTMWRCVWCTGGPGHRLPIIHGHRRPGWYTPGCSTNNHVLASGPTLMSREDKLMLIGSKSKSQRQFILRGKES